MDLPQLYEQRDFLKVQLDAAEFGGFFGVDQDEVVLRQQLNSILIKIEQLKYQLLAEQIVVFYFEGNKITFVEIQRGQRDVAGGYIVYERFRIKGDDWGRWQEKSTVFVDTF